MSAGHTPGPWEFGKDRRWLFRDNLKSDGVFSSSTILKIDDDAFRPNDADARLIAAAPDLLEALEECLPVVGRYESEHESNWALGAHCKATAAIAKARGQ